MSGAAGRLSIDGKLIARAGGIRGGVHGDTVLAGKDGLLPLTDGLNNVRTAVDLTAGSHSVEVQVFGDSSGSPEQVRLAWYTPEQRAADHTAAIAAARNAKTAVVFVWSRDNPVFGLPGDQDKLVWEIAEANPNTIVVLNVSQPIALPWLDKVKAVLQMWWPGDEGGWSTAKLLLGKSSPAGRLPFTWARRLQDYAATDPRYPERSSKGVGGKTTFSEGVNVGYRWFDKEKLDPLFPFGYGLSYATFEYSRLKATRAFDGGLDIQVQIKNTGSMESDEVPQVYLGAPAEIPDGVQFPVRALATFDRIHVLPGESKAVLLHVPLRQLQYWSTKNSKWEIAAGSRSVFVGRSSRDLPLEASIDVR